MPDDDNGGSGDNGGPGSGPFDSPLDDLFVEGARFHEPSAAERREWQKQAEAASKRRKQRERKAARSAKREAGQGRFRKIAPFLLLGGLTVAAYVLFSSGGDDSPVAGALPEQVRVVYALPSDVATDEDLDAAIQNEVEVADAWFRDQTDGAAPRWIDDGGEIAVERRDLTISAEELADRSDAVGLVTDEFRDENGELPTDELLLVFVPVVFENQVRCGEGSAIGIAVIWVGSCDVEPSSTTTEFGLGTSYIVAHEVVHAMGAVESCAPNYGRNGHVIDDPTDVMYEGTETAPSDYNNAALDPGRDDYFDTGRSDCWDVADHPLWD